MKKILGTLVLLSNVIGGVAFAASNCCPQGTCQSLLQVASATKL